MNIFEGSRRIVRAIQIASGSGTVLIVGYIAIFNSRLDVEALLTAFSCIVALEVFSRLAGWVVRGFMGIPSGKDTVDTQTKDSKA